MVFRHQPVFVREYARLPIEIREKFDQIVILLETNPGHPSIRVKKMKGTSAEIWEGRITQNYRFTFQWEADVITFRHIGTHTILRKENR